MSHCAAAPTHPIKNPTACKMGYCAPPARPLTSPSITLQIPLEPAGDAEAENMVFFCSLLGFYFPSINLISEKNTVILLGDLESVGYK